METYYGLFSTTVITTPTGVALYPLIQIKGKKMCEYEMALNYHKEPCDFKDKNRWVRGIADLVIVDGSDAYIIEGLMFYVQILFIHNKR